tara:strand:+ start:1433 stop:2923 length:1491 start_codon:yes stop_codon:yes gene_type:complete
MNAVLAIMEKIRIHYYSMCWLNSILLTSKSKITLTLFHWLGIMRNGFVVMFVALIPTNHAMPGVFEFAGEIHGADVVSHPTGYTGAGSNLVVTVGISPSSPHADEMMTPVQNAVNTWNRLIPTTGNVIVNGNNVPRSQFDFESVALHELGHCIGLAHPNLASESGLTGNDKNFTNSTRGVNNRFDLDSGVDGIIGSSDDMRGDDVNLHWFSKANNNPFAIAKIVDKTTYSRFLADLPLEDLFVANGDRIVSITLSVPNTEAVMQQGILSGESRRSLSADDVATLRLGMSGLDMVADTADDYTVSLRFDGFTNTADIVFNFDNLTSFAACNVTGTFLNRNQNQSPITITGGRISFNTNFSWFFNDDITPLSEQEFPNVSISANNFSDSTTLEQGDNLSLVVALNPGISTGNAADYWVWADTPLGMFWLNNQLDFIRSDSPIRVFGGPLFNLQPFAILNKSITGLPSGTYTVFFAVDDNQDNIVDANFQDTVTFMINP